MTLRRFLKIAAIGFATLVLAVGALALWAWRVELPRQLEAQLGKLDGDVALVPGPVTLGTTPLRLRGAHPLVVYPHSSVCAALTDIVTREDDEDAQFARLMAGADLGAVFHARGGRSHFSKGARWMFRGGDRGTMFACVELRCPCKPDALPVDGTIIDSIDLHADRSLRVERIIWTHPGHIDPKVLGIPADPVPSAPP